MSVLIICPGKEPEPWVKAIKNEHPGIKINVYPEDHEKEEVEYAISWKHPRGVFKNYPNLKVIASMGAGVDHITGDPEILQKITITKVVDEQLSKDMGVFVLALIMDHLRNISYHHNNAHWEQKSYLRVEDVRIGIMGAGNLGQAVAKRLLNNGFQVSGWAREKKNYGNFEVCGEEQKDNFLKNTDILVCLLPLTPQTENILNRDLFEKLPEGAYIINVARGQHLVEQDLLEMVNSGHLSGASLDVFRKEPLPEDHIFWTNDKIKITPHIASVTDPAKVVPQIMENYKRMEKGEPLVNVVKREKGY